MLKRLPTTSAPGPTGPTDPAVSLQADISLPNVQINDEQIKLTRGQTAYELWRNRPEGEKKESFDHWLDKHQIAKTPALAKASNGRLQDPTRLQVHQGVAVQHDSPAPPAPGQGVEKRELSSVVLGPGDSMYSLWRERDTKGPLAKASLQDFCHAYGVAASAQEAKSNPKLLNPQTLKPGTKLVYEQSKEVVSAPLKGLAPELVAAAILPTTPLSPALQAQIPPVSVGASDPVNGLAFAKNVMVPFGVRNILNGTATDAMMAGSFLRNGTPGKDVGLGVLAGGLGAYNNSKDADGSNNGIHSEVVQKMFDGTTLPTGVTTKIFLPNVVISKSTDGKGLLAGVGKKIPPINFNGKSVPLIESKVHGWMSGTVGIEVSRPALSPTAKTRGRMLSVRASALIQPENVNKTNGLKVGQAVNLNTGSFGVQSEYRLVSDEKRVERIATGKEAIPNPFTLENMKRADTVTIDTSMVKGVEAELRLMKGEKSMLRGGVDFKGDLFDYDGDRLLVRMSNGPEGRPTRATIFSGKSASTDTILAAGLIVNPDIQNKTPADKAGFSSAFLRGLAQVKSQTVDNKFHFVEIDVSKPAGRALYDEILKTGVVPTAGSKVEIPNVEAHGILHYTSQKDALALQGAGYMERSRVGGNEAGIPAPWRGNNPDVLGKQVAQRATGGAGQLSMTANVELHTDAQVQRLMEIKQAKPDSSLRLEESNYQMEVGTHDASGFKSAYGFIRKEMDQKDNQNYQKTEEEDGATGKIVRSGYNFTAYDTNKKNVESALTGSLSGPPLFKDFNVITNQGEFSGREAVAELRKASDPREGWFTHAQVDVGIGISSEENAREFSRRLSADIQTYLEKKPWYDDVVTPYEMGQYVGNKWFGTLHRADNEWSLERLADSIKNVHDWNKDLNQTEFSLLLSKLGEIREASGDTRPYPISLNINASY